MKKYLFLLIVSGLLIGCTNVEKAKEEKVITIESEKIYTSFESEMITKYLGDGIIDVDVAPFSKGIDILLTTDSQGMSKERFDLIAREIVKEFKERYNFDKDLSVGVSLDYQPDPSEDAKNIFVTKVK